MTIETTSNNPEKKIMLDDNALKFTTLGIDPQFLQERKARSFLLKTDWLEMNEASEKKLAHKKYDNGDIEILLIQKFTDENGNRTVPPKVRLTTEEYTRYLEESVRSAQKVRFEFEYLQGDTTLLMKYDEFIDSNLRILEVDADDEFDKDSFEPSRFPYGLIDVTGQTEYYGYRVVDLI